MRIQDAVLDYLNRNRGSYVSGEEIAASLGVTRNAVWKAIRKLEADGHRIDAVPKRGYALSADSDVLSAGSVSRYLTTDFPVRLDVRRAVTSTNTLLKAEAEQGAQEGLVLIAEAQTAGKGRLGRQFQSPGSGQWRSWARWRVIAFQRRIWRSSSGQRRPIQYRQYHWNQPRGSSK